MIHELVFKSINLRSIILKCVNLGPDGVGVDLDRSHILILTSLIQLHCDIKPGEDDLVSPVCATLASGHVSPGSYLAVICPLSDEIFLHHQVKG